MLTIAESLFMDNLPFHFEIEKKSHMDIKNGMLISWDAKHFCSHMPYDQMPDVNDTILDLRF